MIFFSFVKTWAIDNMTVQNCDYVSTITKWLLLLDMVEFVGKGSQFFLLICAVLWLQVRKKWVA